MQSFATKEFWSIVIGGSVLAMNAGFINVVTLAGMYTVTVSHVTGNVTKIAITLLQWDITNFSLILSIVISFMFGSFIAGLIVGDNKFRLGKSYGLALLLESLFLFISYFTLKRELILGEWCAAFACGLQNALATSYSGAIVRTTHMTGICTDIGNILGQAMRTDSNAELWRLKVHVPILFSYMAGGLLGQACFLVFRENALLFPCFFIGGVGGVYLVLPVVRGAKVELKEGKVGKDVDGRRGWADVEKDVDGEIRNLLREMEGGGSGKSVAGGLDVANADGRKNLKQQGQQLDGGESFANVNFDQFLDDSCLTLASAQNGRQGKLKSKGDV